MNEYRKEVQFVSFVFILRLCGFLIRIFNRSKLDYSEDILINKLTIEDIVFISSILVFLC